jgi:hypothetical protein
MYGWEPIDSRRVIRCDYLQGLKPDELSNFVVAAKAVTYKADAAHTAAQTSFFGTLF